MVLNETQKDGKFHLNLFQHRLHINSEIM